MEMSLKTGFPKIFFPSPKKSELPKIWGEGGGGLQLPSAPQPERLSLNTEINSIKYDYMPVNQQCLVYFQAFVIF